MERPALKQLLADIASGSVDVVVVYKIDRLTRALADFARMVELFDRHAVSFVSVTQAFNTTSSMGRLTLNVLLSFAQFEREVTGERIRDKIAASKAKGMWMGGTLPLGYDRPVDGSRALVVNTAEAETVRTIYASYLDLGSVHALERWLREHGIRSKRRTTKIGRTLGGHPFSRGALFHLLRNRTYLGMTVHKDKIHPGMHPAILDVDLFEAVQSRLDVNARRRTARRDHVARAALVGRIFGTDGQPMSPTFSRGRKGKLYRYYVSAPLQQSRQRKTDDTAIRRVPAGAIEARVSGVLDRIGVSGSSDSLASLARVEVHADSLHLLMAARLLPKVRAHLAVDEQVEANPADPSLLRLVVPVRMKLRGGRTWVEDQTDKAVRTDPVLVKALRSAHAMIERDSDDMPVLDQGPASPYRRRLVRLAFLSPDLQRAILAGRQPADLTLAQLMDGPMPLSWLEQERRFGRVES